MSKLLEVIDLNVTFRTEDEIVYAVRDVSFTVNAGSTHCIVGESGSGKSASCHAILGLTPENGLVSTKAIRFKGVELSNLSETKLQEIRGAGISMVFQDPMSSLNPVHSVGWQIVETLRLHRGLDHSQAEKRAVEMLDMVGIPEPSQRFEEYPHQLSGGMCQRAMIAMALACEPSLLIADEPTTALDVTVQAQILDLINRLKSEMGMAVILITHDLGVVAEMADSVTVMRHGQVMEDGPVKRIFEKPEHDYTKELLSQVPRLDHPSPVYEPPFPGRAS